jgi:uncharacterized NAD-dependent epimerase/dehydratase family protein
MLNRSVSAQLRSFARDDNPIVLYTAGHLARQRFTTPTEAFLRHTAHRVIGIADERARTDSLETIEAWSWAGPVPVAPSPLDLLTDAPDGTDLVVGISLPGHERLRKVSRDALVEVAEAGHRVINGLNDLIRHPNIINLKSFTPDQRLSVTKLDRRATRISTLGTDPAGPTLSTAIELSQALLDAGWAAEWVPTSSTGILLNGFGRPIDAAPAHAAANLLIDSIHTAESVAEVLVIEGQGGLTDPATTSLAATIATTASSHYHVLCHRPTGGEEDLSDTLRQAVDRYDAFHRAGGSVSTLLGISLDTSAVNELEARRSLDTARALGVPAVEWVRGVEPLVAALSALTEQERQA